MGSKQLVFTAQTWARLHVLAQRTADIAQASLACVSHALSVHLLCRYWFAPAGHVTPGKLLQLDRYGADPETVWPTAAITVKTSPEWQADTDANVWITLIGSKGSTRRVELTERLRAPQGGSAGTYSRLFQRGSGTVFCVSIPDIGKLNAIEVGHDGAGLSPAWGLDFVTIACDKGMCTQD
jgi:PLAT/LH2 domain